MRTRKLLGPSLVELGPMLVAVSLSAAVFHHTLPISNDLVAAIAILFPVLGLIVLITGILEGWLSRSQAALVDGLQPG
jgi:hypothetical protein